MVVTSTTDFMSTSHDEFSWDAFKKSKETTSIAVDIVDIYTDRLLARVSGDDIGSRLVSYLPESGIVEGAAATLEIFSGKPIVTRILSLGALSKNSILFDIQEKKASKKVQRIKSSQPDSDYEDVASESVIVKHKSGEKVFNVMFSGIKIGYSDITIFNGLDSSAIFGKTGTIIESPSVALMSSFGKILVSSDKLGNSSSEISVSENSEGNIRPIYKSYRGNVSLKMSEDGIIIESTHLKIPSIEKMVMLDIVLNYSVDDFEADQKTTIHTYEGRKLSFSGGSSSTREAPLYNSVLKNRSRISFNGSDASLGSVNGVPVAIVYLKAVDTDGNITEFSAGDSIRKSSGLEKSMSFDREEYSIGKKSSYNQGGVIDITTPVSEKMLNIRERYGRIIDTQFGDSISKNFRRLTEYKIWKNEVYEEDEDSGIPTVDMLYSPNIIFKGCIVVRDLEKTSSGIVPIDRTKMSADSGEEITYEASLRGTPRYGVSIKDGKDKSSFGFDNNNMIFETQGNVKYIGKVHTFYGERTRMKTSLNVEKGLRCKGDFIIEAKNIILNASAGIYIESEEYMIAKTKIIYFEGTKNVLFKGKDNVEDEDGKPLPSPFLSLSDTAVLTGNKVAIVANDTATMYAGKLVAISAEKVSIPRTQ